MDWNEFDMETTILSITTPSVPMWVVYASEEQGGPDDIWTDPVILWALIDKHLNQEIAESNESLGKEVPRPQRMVVGMVNTETGPELAGDTEFILVGYSLKQEIDREEWEDRARWARKRSERIFRQSQSTAAK